MKHILILLFLALTFCEVSFSQENKTQLLIVYYSRTGNTKIMAEAVARGAQGIDNVQVKLCSVDSASIEDVKSADAIILGSPVYNANTAPEIQEFINKWPFKHSPLKNKIGAAFVTGGGISAGEEIVLTNILKSMLIFGMIIVGGDGWQSAFGASAITSEEPFSKSVDQNFLTKAQALGKRVAEIASKFNQ